MNRLLFIVPALALAALAPQRSEAQAQSGGLPATTQSIGLTTFPATTYGGVWDGDAGHDVGPAINAAIAAAAANGGGIVLLPPNPAAGHFYFATNIPQNTSGVQIQGAGLGIPRDSFASGAFQAKTLLLWNGVAEAGPALAVQAVGSQTLYAAGLTGFAVDCGSLVDTCVQITQVGYSTFYFGQAEARKTGILFDTNSIDGGGDQFNDVWLVARNIDPAYSASGIVLDGGAGAPYNFSYNRVHMLRAAFGAGDGVVMGNSDTNIVDQVSTFHYGSATTGTPFVCANRTYAPPSGVAVQHECYDNNFNLMGSAAVFTGATAGLTWTPGANAGTAALNPVTLTTNGTTSAASSVLNFASTTGVAAKEAIKCGGATSGVMPYITVNAVTSTTVTMAQNAVASGGVSGVASGLSCTFSLSATQNAVAGSYTLTALDATHFSVTAPAGGHTQASVAYSGGMVNATDFSVPLTGTPVANDTFTLVFQPASRLNNVLFVDKANSAATPFYESTASSANPPSYTTDYSMNGLLTAGVVCMNCSGGSSVTLLGGNAAGALHLQDATGTGPITAGNSNDTFTIGSKWTAFSGGPPSMPVYTVSTLPSTAGTGKVQGATAIVTDATTCTKNGALVGSSSTVCVVYYNGTAWLGS